MDSGSFRRTQISSSGCRGTGLSDRQLTGHSPEQRSEDLIAVMDAAGSAEAVLLGWLSGATSLLTAALHPTRVRGVVAGEVLAAGHPDADHFFGAHPEMQRMLAQALETGDWGVGRCSPGWSPRRLPRIHGNSPGGRGTRAWLPPHMPRLAY
jgi:pimeloyl-ACP methyl ester carboxylesterase